MHEQDIKRSPEPISLIDQPFLIPMWENPVSFGANAIREEVKSLVKDTVFPKNYVYAVGDYNLVFNSIESHGNQGGGFSEWDRMIVLDKNGEFLTGNVDHDVQSWTNSWKFNKAKLSPASDLEVVKHSYELLNEYFEVLTHEIGDFENLDEIIEAYSALSKRGAVLRRLQRITRATLKEMGEEEIEEEEPYGNEVYLNRLRGGLSLYGEKNRILEEIRSASSTGRAPMVEEKIKELVEKAVSRDIFALDTWGPVKFEDGQVVTYVSDGQPLNHRLSDRVNRYHGDESWTLAITKDGKIVEAQLFFNKSQRRCAEHIIEAAGYIGESIIAKSVGSVFPNLKWDSFDRDFTI